MEFSLWQLIGRFSTVQGCAEPSAIRMGDVNHLGGQQQLRITRHSPQPAAAIEPTPVVAAARVPPITGTVAITAVDAAATLEIAEAIAGRRNNITFSPFKLSRGEMRS